MYGTFEFFQTWSRRDGTVGRDPEHCQVAVRSFGKGSGDRFEHAGGHLSTCRREITRRFATKAQCAASQVSEMASESGFSFRLSVCENFMAYFLIVIQSLVKGFFSLDIKRLV